MRYLKIFFLHFQNAFVYKGISFVYFLMSVFNIGLTVLFWRGAANGKAIAQGWYFSDIFTYYMLALIANQLLISHMENTVANIDIHEGNLSAYLLKPFSYFTTRFMSETPWRFVSTVLGLVIFFFFYFIIKISISFAHSPLAIFLAVCVAILGYFISFLFKMLLGILAFWVVEMRGLFEGTDAVTSILMGSFMPLVLLPQWITSISNFSPFPYMIYYPVVAFEGKLNVVALLFIILKEILWTGGMWILYKFLWQKGIEKYSAIGQ